MSEELNLAALTKQYSIQDEEDKKADEKIFEMVGFKLGNEEFMVDINKIREIIMKTDITYVPRIPPYFEGVINLRGNIVPIINMRKKLGMKSEKFTKDSRILIMEVNDMLVGFIVDKITKVILIPERNIEPTPVTFGGMASEFIYGVGRHENRIIGWVNIEKLVEDCEVK